MPESENVTKRVLALDHDGCLGEIVDLIYYGKDKDLSQEDRDLLLDPTMRSMQTSQDWTNRHNILERGLKWAMNLLKDEVTDKTLESIDDGLKGEINKAKGNPKVFLESIKVMLDKIKEADVLCCGSNRQDAASDALLAKCNKNGSNHELINMLAEVENERRREQDDKRVLTVDESLLDRKINTDLDITHDDTNSKDWTKVKQQQAFNEVIEGINKIEEAEDGHYTPPDNQKWGKCYLCQEYGQEAIVCNPYKGEDGKKSYPKNITSSLNQKIKFISVLLCVIFKKKLARNFQENLLKLNFWMISMPEIFINSIKNIQSIFPLTSA